MNRYVILIPFHNPWDWHTDYANQTAILLSRTHEVVCFLWADAVSLWELLRKKRTYAPIQRLGNIWKIQPLFLIPGKRFFVSQIANMALNMMFVYIWCSVRALRRSRTKLFWFFGYYDPVFLLLPPLFGRWKTVYDCVDIAVHPESALDRLIRWSERNLLRSAWIVTVNSRTLFEKLLPYRKEIQLVPLGFRRGMFTRPVPHPTLAPRNRPVIGYIGSIDYRLDVPLLSALIIHNRRWQFALFGPVFADHMSKTEVRSLQKLLMLPNVTHGSVPPARIPGILARCDVAIIPYDIRTPLSRYAFPMKIMEYFYAQKPVVSTPIQELLRFAPLIRIARTQDEWEEAIGNALGHPLTGAQKTRMRRIANAHTWERKIRRILDSIEAQGTQ